MIPCWALNLHHGVCNPLAHWDSSMLWDLLAGRLWPHVPDVLAPLETPTIPHGPGGVVVVAGGFHGGEEELISRQIRNLGWVLLIVASDEQRLFDWRAVRHRRMAVWVMTPRPGLDDAADGFLGEGWRPGTRELTAEPGPERTTRWGFAGQVTHSGRMAAAAAMRRTPGGRIYPTAMFAATEEQGGLPQAEYVNLLRSVRAAPAPAGPCTPDSFRLYEALEAGAVPLAAAECPGWEKPGYWRLLFGADPPFPVIDDWRDLPDVVDAVCEEWPRSAVEVGAWWAAEKRRLAGRLRRQVAGLRGIREASLSVTMADYVTVVVSTSPIPSHPDDSILAETIASIRAQPDLAGCEILIAADGVRPEDEDRRGAYLAFLERVVWRSHHDPTWAGVAPLVGREWRHQAGTFRSALREVTTPLVLFVEHDTPVCGPVPWVAMVGAIFSGKANTIRLSHEAAVLPEHEYLFLDDGPVDVEGVPLRRTSQWSQRPHLASVAWYQRIMDRFFADDARTMIEDCIYGPIVEATNRYGDVGWAEHRTWLYHPAGDIKRSTHTDGRAGAPKYPMRFAYPGPPPESAPPPTPA